LLVALVLSLEQGDATEEAREVSARHKKVGRLPNPECRRRRFRGFEVPKLKIQQRAFFKTPKIDVIDGDELKSYELPQGKEKGTSPRERAV
jgi:hypothetical protein